MATRIWLPSLYLIHKTVLLSGKTFKLWALFSQPLLIFSLYSQIVYTEISPLVARIAFILKIQKSSAVGWWLLWSKLDSVLCHNILLQLLSFSQEVYFRLCYKCFFKNVIYMGKALVSNGWNMMFVFWGRTDVSFIAITVNPLVYYYFSASASINYVVPL